VKTKNGEAVMEDGIGNIGSQDNVSGLLVEQEGALRFLYADPEVERELNGIAFRFRQDKDDLRQEIALKLSMDSYALRDIKCLKSWCYVTAMNICRNNHRHEKVVKRHGERCAGESVLCRRGGGAVVVQHSEVKTPEQGMLELELEALHDDRVSELRARLRKRLVNIIGSLPKDVQVVARLWDEGKSPVEIAQVIGKSVKTVYRKHKEFQMEIVEKSGLAAAATDKMLVAGLQPLISYSLRSATDAVL
jgi:RNA polymerase sigma factor (sigma-70 family)